jgi:hypothetical protein
VVVDVHDAVEVEDREVVDLVERSVRGSVSW